MTAADRWTLVRGADIPRRLRHLLLVLMHYQRENQTAWCKREALADELGVHVDKITQKLKELETFNLIERTWTTRNNHPSREYAIRFDVLASSTEGSTVTDAIRLPPQNLDAERCVLGSMMFLNAAIDEIDLKPDEYYSAQHAILHGVIVDMWRSGCRAIDPVTLTERLQASGRLAEVGGASYLAEIIEEVPHAAHIRYYAGIVRKKARHRALITACAETLQEAYGDDSDGLVSQLETKLLNIRETSTSGGSVSAAEALAAAEERQRNPAAVHSTGLVDLDRQIRGGFRDGQFVVIGGRPGTGKSVLACQVAATFAARGETSLVVSLEMDAPELAERGVASMPRETFRDLPMRFIDSVFEARQITSSIRVEKRKHNIQVAILDYLQLTEPDDRKVSRERQVAEVSRSMKQLAAELRIPVIAACQLNRASDKEQRLPRLSDLRESGSIEQDADIVLLLHQDDIAAKCIVAKQRNGCTGFVPLTFRGDRFRFEDHSHYTGDM